MTQRDTAGALAWYRTHTSTSTIGFNPNGMCLKICRTARNIGAKYPSAISSQLATPKANRITNLNAIVPGMVMYFDDPKDSNPYGHIVTVESRDMAVRSLADIIVWTNSVKSGMLTKVRADYFPEQWGDGFVFASNVLNGVNLLLPKADLPEALPGPLAGGKGPRLRHAIEDITAMIEYQKGQKQDRLVAALERDLAELKQTLTAFD